MLRSSGPATTITSISMSATSSWALQGYCVPGCAEDVIGFTFYKYVLTNVVSINCVELLTALARKCLHMESHIDAPWVSALHLMTLPLLTQSKQLTLSLPT